jgi:DNA-binding Lrp family transcriptional regulator
MSPKQVILLADDFSERVLKLRVPAFVIHMEAAHILIKYDDENNSLDDIKSIDGVKEIQRTFGVYNVIIKIEAESVQKLKKILAEKIRGKQGILSTLTLITA